jgi:hypothetical protein
MPFIDDNNRGFPLVVMQIHDYPVQLAFGVPPVKLRFLPQLVQGFPVKIAGRQFGVANVQDLVFSWIQL